MTGAALIDDPRLLLRVLLGRGLRVIAPREVDGVIAYAPLTDPDDLPRGRTDEQGPGRYRLTDGDPSRWFDYVVGPAGWKSWLHPPRRLLWRAVLDDSGIGFEACVSEWPETVFFGVRPCELAAIARQRRILAQGPHADPDYGDRLAKTLVVVVQCARSAPTCFCASMDAGPRAAEGFDLAITELGADDGGGLVVESGSEAGDGILAELKGTPATGAHLAAARRASRSAEDGQSRRMPANVAVGLKERLESPVWDHIAARCLSCGACTLACPTCFCSDVEDASDLSGRRAERWRVWDSCFDIDFSYIHGGAVRGSRRARYRQWMTHKLSHWRDQFGESGCVGCGRCIAWCPVGIDIVAEAAALLHRPVE